MLVQCSHQIAGNGTTCSLVDFNVGHRRWYNVLQQCAHCATTLLFVNVDTIFSQYCLDIHTILLGCLKVSTNKRCQNFGTDVETMLTPMLWQHCHNVGALAGLSYTRLYKKYGWRQKYQHQLETRIYLVFSTKLSAGLHHSAIIVWKKLNNVKWQNGQPIFRVFLLTSGPCLFSNGT